MNNRVFGEVKFNMGWETSLSLVIFGLGYKITVSADSFYENDLITEAQENAYSDFLRNRDEWIKRTEEALLNYDGNAEKKYKPALLKIDRDGTMAMLFDDTENVEDGIAICLTPKMEAIPVDAYL
ncbi:DUF6985 domain-containing protein [Butyrivibrio sp. AC2005]|uniref:DUF6985 domain-containing protein n=1 Tax=Butyrivibrio sp. AC2005 TaxID=1280672 RepID=UPI000402BEAE|nr:hypothetical protein [Butyrivibrio sp. AC2005]